MKTQIHVEPLPDGAFQVCVVEGSSESSHRVTLKPEYLNRLAHGKIESQDFVRRAFDFLLEREPKESILSRFDLQDIQRYFPDFEREIERRISTSAKESSR